MIDIDPDDAEWTDDPKYKDVKCHYCDIELDDGNVFAEDLIIPGRFYCVSCLEENMDDMEARLESDH